MPSSIKLYTTGNMEAAHMHNSPPEATGHPAESALDNNLDTYWEPTTTAKQYFIIDLGSAKQVDCALLFVKNYTTFGDNTDIGCYWSDNGSDWTGIQNFPTVKDTATPIRINTDGFSGLSAHRYWRLVIGDPMDEVIKLAGVWWGSYYDIDQGNVLPQEDEDQFHNRVSQLPGGRLAVAGINRNQTENFYRRYLIKSGDSSLDDLRNAHQDSRGIRHLLVINEGTVQNEARIVRFAEDTFPRPIRARELYDIEMRFEGIPYIDDGDSY